MANGETRNAIKTTADSLGRTIGDTATDATNTVSDAAHTATKGIQRLAIGIGKGIKDFAKESSDAVKSIIEPHVISEKLEYCFDAVAIQPTKRAFDFLTDSSHLAIGETDTDHDHVFKRKVKDARGGMHRMKVVFATPLQDITGVNFVGKKYYKSDEDRALIGEALRDNFVFAHLSHSKRDEIIDAFEPVLVNRGVDIITEGEIGDFFYVLGAGDVEFRIGGEHVGNAGKGQSFGELALLYNAPRAATCTAKTECGLFRLDQETFRRRLAQQNDDGDVIQILKTVPYFKDLDQIYLSKISCNLKVATFKEGEELVHKGDDVKIFGIVMEGEVHVTDVHAGGTTYKDMTFTKGQYFGDVAIVDDAPCFAKMTAKTAVTALTLNRETFVRVLGDDMGKLVKKTKDKRRLKLIPFGKEKAPADNELDLLAASIIDKKFPKGHAFFTEGQKCEPALYLIRKGKVSIHSSSLHRLEHEISEGGYFGNDTLDSHKEGQSEVVAQNTVQATEDVEVGVLDLKAIESVVSARGDPSKESIEMKDLDMIRILGAGTFGKVWLVSRKGTKEAYALKVHGKKQLIKTDNVLSVIREKNIMKMIDHPFIIKLVSSYQDEDKVYMLVKLYQGGELHSIIHTDSRDGLPQWAACFYAANILEGLSYMHRRHIVHRDLKPENVLLDSDGYAVIVDLGFAKLIKHKTYTFCGTPLYLAPEIITNKGHDKGADHWSWGVLLYEMLVGVTPFYDGGVHQIGLYKNIVKCKYEFPGGDFMSFSSKDLIRQMLVVNPTERLGSFAKADEDIRSHSFFKDFDWEALVQKKATVPFKPKVSDPLDGSNFDDFSKLEAEEKKGKTKKLTAKEQLFFKRF